MKTPLSSFPSPKDKLLDARSAALHQIEETRHALGQAMQKMSGQAKTAGSTRAPSKPGAKNQHENASTNTSTNASTKAPKNSSDLSFAADLILNQVKTMLWCELEAWLSKAFSAPQSGPETEPLAEQGAPYADAQGEDRSADALPLVLVRHWVRAYPLGSMLCGAMLGVLLVTHRRQLTEATRSIFRMSECQVLASNLFTPVMSQAIIQVITRMLKPVGE